MDTYMPDLEPISINVRQFDHDLLEIKAEKQKGIHVLISPFVGIKQFAHYISTISMTHISEAATATRITLILIDKSQDVPI